MTNVIHGVQGATSSDLGKVVAALVGIIVGALLSTLGGYVASLRLKTREIVADAALDALRLLLDAVALMDADFNSIAPHEKADRAAQMKVLVKRAGVIVGVVGRKDLSRRFDALVASSTDVADDPTGMTVHIFRYGLRSALISVMPFVRDPKARLPEPLFPTSSVAYRDLVRHDTHRSLGLDWGPLRHEIVRLEHAAKTTPADWPSTYVPSDD